MSLIQQGSQTAKNKNPKLPTAFHAESCPPIAISMWNDEAHVLSRTWPACGNFVLGLKYAISTPVMAAGITKYQPSIKPMCACSAKPACSWEWR